MYEYIYIYIPGPLRWSEILPPGTQLHLRDTPYISTFGGGASILKIQVDILAKVL